VASRIAVKRLSAVEVDTGRSRQHEFHASRLRTELGFDVGRVTGPLIALIFEADGVPAFVDESVFTLYDAREKVPTRSPEWHLYYTSTEIPQRSRAGDLALMYRRDSALQLLIARRGTKVERDLLDALAIGSDAVREQFEFLDVPLPAKDDGRQIAAQLTLPVDVAADYPVIDHPLFKKSVGESSMPVTSEMASAASEIAGMRLGEAVDPDGYLTGALTAESDLYYAIESTIHAGSVAKLMEGDPSVTDIIDFAMRLQQSRKSRRGQSLQNHFARLLDRERIPYSAQCLAEAGETPDFVIPGCDQYHDATFPSNRLRMVACKSTAKERWRQILNEAARIPEKYLLTLDSKLNSVDDRRHDPSRDSRVHPGVNPEVGVRRKQKSRIEDGQRTRRRARGGVLRKRCPTSSTRKPAAG
jgi:hypothetical protein